jgi:predicted dehydrogenase
MFAKLGICQGPSRRDFLRNSSAALVGGAVAAGSGMVRAAHPGGSDVIRVGLVGCGGRGTGAATQAVGAGPAVKLVAMGDVFRDRLEQSLRTLRNEVSDKLEVTPDRCFTGFDAYKQVIDCDIDLVVLCAPPHFRPAHMKYAVERGKHIFAEKPVAVDAPGVRSVLATCEEAAKKKLSVVSGLCWRYDFGVRETMSRVHDGAVGKIVAMQCTYNTGGLWMHLRKPEWTDMEWQLRNWLYFTWLSGDHNVEQHVHSLDKMAWAVRDQFPVRAAGVGGRQARNTPEYGHIYDHHAVVYEFANGVRLFSQCRQTPGCDNDITDHIFGTEGICHIDGYKQQLLGKVEWRNGPKPKNNMYQTEHDELIASIRSGSPINNGDYMCKSTLMAIMGRMATYTGKVITWDQALHSKEDLTPGKYEFGPMAVAPVAMPGTTPFV